MELYYGSLLWNFYYGSLLWNFTMEAIYGSPDPNPSTRIQAGAGGLRKVEVIYGSAEKKARMEGRNHPRQTASAA